MQVQHSSVRDVQLYRDLPRVSPLTAGAKDRFFGGLGINNRKQPLPRVCVCVCVRSPGLLHRGVLGHFLEASPDWDGLEDTAAQHFRKAKRSACGLRSALLRESPTACLVSCFGV